MDKPIYVCGFMFSADMKDLAMILKQKPSWQAGCYNGIGGKVEGDESPSEAMKREFEEEAGVITDKNKWEQFLTIRGIGDEPYEVYCFKYATDMVYEVKTMEEEKIHIIVNVQEKLRDLKTISNLQWIIPMCYDPAHHSGTVFNR